MSSSSDSNSRYDIYTLEELQQMLTDPELSSIVESKIETEVLARLSTKSQNGSPILGTLVTPSKQQNILDQIGEAEKVLSKCTTPIEQMNQETMRQRKEAASIIQN
eukprot:jgi/Psemu1/47402/gm1.47402_g